MKKAKTIYRVSLDGLPGHIFYFRCNYRDEKDLNKQVTKRFGIGITYTFEIASEEL